MRRMEELATILRRHGKDYLYLGQREVPKVADQPRRMLPDIREAEHASTADKTTRDARALGDADLALPALVLRDESNLRLFPETGRIRVVGGPGSETKAYFEALERIAVGGRIRIVGGEATLSRRLARVLAASRKMVRTCVLETNGLRFSQRQYAQTMVRYGLTHAVVLLLGLDAATADTLGGVDGGFALAFEGVRELVAAQVHTEVGLVVSEPTLEALPRLSEVVAEHLPGVRQLRVVATRLHGSGAPAPANPARIEEAVASLLREAGRRGQRVVLEDRG